MTLAAESLESEYGLTLKSPPAVSFSDLEPGGVARQRLRFSVEAPVAVPFGVVAFDYEYRASAGPTITGRSYFPGTLVVYSPAKAAKVGNPHAWLEHMLLSAVVPHLAVTLPLLLLFFPVPDGVLKKLA